MKYLVLETGRPTLRSNIDGFTVEDTAKVNLDKPIGLSGGPTGWYDPSLGGPPVNPNGSPADLTVLHALAKGWRLLGPPMLGPQRNTTAGGQTYTSYIWWLTKQE